MRFVCDSCRAQYMISDEKVGAKGVKVRCKKCGYVILVRRQDTGAQPAVAEERRASPETGNGAGQNAVLKGVEDDEIGAVFDQVLAGGSGPKARPQIDAAMPDALDEDGGDATRVMDLATMKALAEQSGEPVPAADSSEGSSGESNAEAPAPVASHEWFVAIDEKQVGPLSLEQVKEHWDKGEVGPDSLCWRAGFSDWMPVADADELASILAPKPPKPLMAAPVVTGAAASAPVESAFAAGTSSGIGKAARSDIPVLAPEPATEADISWKPSAASALASLVQDEMKALEKPAAKKPNGVPAQEAAPSVSGLLDVPEATGPQTLPQPAVDRTGPVAATVTAPPQHYSSPPTPYVPTYAVPAQPRGRGVLIGVLAGVGGVVVLGLIGAVVYLLQEKESGRVAPPPTVAVAPAPTVPTPAPTTASPATAATPTGTPSGAVAAVPTPPPTPVAAAVREPEPARTAVVTVPPPTRERPVRAGGRRNPPPDEGSLGRRDTPAPPSAPDTTGDEFEDVFGSPKAGAKPAAAAAKPKPSVYVPPPPGQGGEVLDRLGQSDIMQVVVSHKSSILKCVEEHKKKEPGSSGKLVVRWVVLTSGRTSGIAVQTEDLKGSGLATCITGLVRSWTFPKSKQQADPIDFPFTF